MFATKRFATKRYVKDLDLDVVNKLTSLFGKTSKKKEIIRLIVEVFKYIFIEKKSDVIFYRKWIGNFFKDENVIAIRSCIMESASIVFKENLSIKVEGLISSEEFIDKIIDRINRKQLREEK